MNSQENNQPQIVRLQLGDVNDSEKLKLILEDAAKNYLGMTYESLQELLLEKDVDRMLGCMFGAFLADSLGSFCQFQRKAQCMQLSEQTMTMPGGGPFQLLPGQVTDDSQMALHLLQGLLAYDRKVPLEVQTPNILISIAKQYIQWVTNIPFDIGFTTRTAITQLAAYLPLKPTENISEQYKSLQKAFDEIKKHNQNSLSNGFMMRITPMACFKSLLIKYNNQEMKSFGEILKKEVNMTHSNQVCVHAASIYLEVLGSMILRSEHADIAKIYQFIQAKFKNTSNQNIIGSAIEEAFISHQEKDKDICQADGRDAGFFRIAFYYVFYAFREIAVNCKSEQELTSQLYKKLIKFTIEQGGDTDTNACIVGGLVGSIVGFKNLPVEYLVKHLNLKLGQSEYRSNEKTYEPINGFVNLIKLIRKFR